MCVCVRVCVVFRVIHRVTSYLQSRDIAHNFFLTRGTPFTIDNEQTQANSGAGQQTSTVRAYLWPRKSVFGEFSSCLVCVCVRVCVWGGWRVVID